MIRQTHTYATLEVSPAAYDEIAGKLRAAEYGHAFMEDGTIDMHGIGLTRGKEDARPAFQEYSGMSYSEAAREAERVMSQPFWFAQDQQVERVASLRRIMAMRSGNAAACRGEK